MRDRRHFADFDPAQLDSMLRAGRMLLVTEPVGFTAHLVKWLDTEETMPFAALVLGWICLDESGRRGVLAHPMVIPRLLRSLIRELGSPTPAGSAHAVTTLLGNLAFGPEGCLAVVSSTGGIETIAETLNAAAPSTVYAGAVALHRLTRAEDAVRIMRELPDLLLDLSGLLSESTCSTAPVAAATIGAIAASDLSLLDPCGGINAFVATLLRLLGQHPFGQHSFSDEGVYVM